MKRLISALLLLFTPVFLSVTVVVAATAVVDEDLATLRKFALNEQPEPPVMSKTLNTDRIPARSYPMQPPIIPHKIDNYQVDLKVNKCMSCHARGRVEETQARMISVTHYMDRDGNFLAELSPRRYFCQQCHVAQTDAKQLVGTDFTDLDTLIDQEQ
ncbi:nitrate reductase cytochrome c-type subunit [Photobacterium sp. SDRW27]|uniref:nitrate reductase cytochrome c-type subunit n=1 Tax=Photobacterium obscurum TaxID=2829490 RepID=UPI002243BF74|nr:nitrate reductase cytochrome c-type subunit [Photobacterium obscurum]MCW8331253.1 nitrate reductase cytochrome c-type subunit [Photobacterium obscurum]